MRRDRSGQAIVLVVLSLIALLGMAAISVTYGVVAFTQTRLQNAVDAAALAGAQLAGHGQNPTTDQAWLRQQNLGPHGTLTVSFSHAVVNGVQATGVVTVPGGFASVLGIHTFTVRATAVATFGAPSPFNDAVYQHAPSPLTSNDVLDVTGAVHTNGPITIDGTYCATQGITDGSGATIYGSPTCSTAVTTSGSQPWPAQWTLAQMTPPDAQTITQANFYKNSGSPYVANGNIIFDPTGGTVSFYQGLTVNGNILIEGNAVFDKNLTVNGSIVVWGGSATVNKGLTQPNPGTAGVALAVMGPAGGTYNLTIDSGGSQTGILYVPQGTLTLNQGIDLNGSLIAQQLALYGAVDVTYDAQLLPPQFPITHTVQLVS